MVEKIGIIIWGCKGGYRPFCDNNVVNIMSVEIKQTIKDIRSFITISQPGIDFYALEFTPNYKVYTQYRSSNDSGSGAFTAVTLFVPHKTKIDQIRTILNKMMDAYFLEYMNPITNAPLQGKYDDITIFADILKQYEDNIKADNRKEYYEASAQDDNPKLIIYDDVSVIDKYYDSPYRPEFYSCQEVMFLSSELHSHQEQYAVKFFTSPAVISQVSEPKPQNTIACFPPHADAKLTKFVVNGVDYTEEVKTEAVSLNNSYQISLSLERDYYQPLTYEGIVTDIIATRIIQRKGENFVFAQKYMMEPQSYFLKFRNMNPSVSEKTLIPHIYLVDEEAKQVYQLTEKENRYGFDLRGSAVSKKYVLYFSFVPKWSTKSAIPLHDVLALSVFRADAFIETAIKEEHLKFSYVDHKPEEIKVAIRLRNSENPIRLLYKSFSERRSLLVPESVGLSLSDFTFEASGFSCALVNQVFEFTPISKAYELYVPQRIRTFVTGLDCKVGSAAVGFFPVQQRGSKFVVNLPYQLNVEEAKLQLYIDKTAFPTVKKSKTELAFYSVVLINNCSRDVQYSFTSDESGFNVSSTFTISKSSTILYPKGTTITIAEQELDANIRFDEKGSSLDSYMELMEIVDVPRSVVHKDHVSDTSLQHKNYPSSNSYQSGISQQDKTEKSVLPIRVELINCQGWMFEGKKGDDDTYKFYKVDKSRIEITVNRPYFKLYSSKREEVFALYFNGEDYDEESARRNRDNGFEVKWHSDQVSVEYRPSLTQKVMDLLSKFNFLVVSFVVLLLLGIGISCYFYMSKTEDNRKELTLTLLSNGLLKRINVKDNYLEVNSDSSVTIDVDKYVESSESTIDFKDDPKNPLSFKEIFQLDSVKTAIHNLQDITEGEEMNVKVDIQSRAHKEYLRIVEREKNKELTFSECKNYAQAYPYYKEKFARMAADIVKNSGFAKELVDSFKETPAFSESEYSKTVDQGFNNREKIAGLQKNFKDMMSKLDQLTCTKKDVDKILDFIGENPEVATSEQSNKVQAYKDFFNETGIKDDIIPYFTEDQQYLIRNVLFNNSLKDKPRDFNRCYEILKEMGGKLPSEN